jgi:hypothetical protein
MNENRWTYCQTGVVIPLNQPPGSPRMWLSRIHGVASVGLEDAHPPFRTISVAGVWPRTCHLPEVAHHSIYRIFEHDLKPVMGMAVCAPAHEILSLTNLFKSTGAEMTWYNWPGAKSEPLKIQGHTATGRLILDHQQLYEQFELGIKPAVIARETGVSLRSISYVFQKWSSGKPADKVMGLKRTGALDHEAIAQDIRLGIPSTEISIKYNCSRMMIYNVMKKYELKGVRG